jgi:hypothetical protein
MISTKGVEITQNSNNKKSPYLSYGVHILKINDIECETAATGSVRARFRVESEPIMQEDFEGVDGAKGQVGSIFGLYLKTQDQESDFLRCIAQIADAMGVRQQLDDIVAEDIKSYIEKVAHIFKGKWARFLVATQQYLDINSGKTKNRLGFPKYDFVEPITVPESESKLRFDKTKTYHFRPVQASEMPVNQGSDLPI